MIIFAKSIFAYQTGRYVGVSKKKDLLSTDDEDSDVDCASDLDSLGKDESPSLMEPNHVFRVGDDVVNSYNLRGTVAKVYDDSSVLRYDIRYNNGTNDNGIEAQYVYEKPPPRPRNKKKKIKANWEVIEREDLVYVNDGDVDSSNVLKGKRRL